MQANENSSNHPSSLTHQPNSTMMKPYEEHQRFESRMKATENASPVMLTDEPTTGPQSDDEGFKSSATLNASDSSKPSEGTEESDMDASSQASMRSSTDKPCGHESLHELMLHDNSTEERSVCGASLDPLAMPAPKQRKTLRLNKRKLTRRVLQRMN